jgi:hypothetical protein
VCTDKTTLPQFDDGNHRTSQRLGKNERRAALEVLATVRATERRHRHLQSLGADGRDVERLMTGFMDPKDFAEKLTRRHGKASKKKGA